MHKICHTANSASSAKSKDTKSREISIPRDHDVHAQKCWKNKCLPGPWVAKDLFVFLAVLSCSVDNFFVGHFVPCEDNDKELLCA